MYIFKKLKYVLFYIKKNKYFSYSKKMTDLIRTKNENTNIIKFFDDKKQTNVFLATFNIKLK